MVKYIFSLCKLESITDDIKEKILINACNSRNIELIKYILSLKLEFKQSIISIFVFF